MTEESPELIRRIPPEAAEEEAKSGSSEVSDGGTAEAKQLSRGLSLRDLKKEAEESEHERTEAFRDLFDTLIKIGMSLAFGAVIAFSFTWVWHLITPPSWHWLDDTQIGHIQNLVTGGVLAALVSDHFKRRLG